MDLRPPLPLWLQVLACLLVQEQRLHTVFSCQAISLPFSVFVPPAWLPGPLNMNDNTQHKLATASAHGLQHRFSLSLPGYFCHEIRGKEKKFLLLFLHFFFFSCKGSGAGPAPSFCCAQQPRVPRKERQQGHLPLPPAGHSSATGLVGHAGSSSSAIPSEGNGLL